MLKKIIIGVLLFSVIGAAGAAYAYNAFSQEAETTAAGPVPLANGASSNEETEADQTTSEAQSAPLAAGLEGEPWEASGTIGTIDANGFDLLLDSGESVYVELGPADYWQSQGVELATGQAVTVEGSINEDMMIHANQVTLADDQVLALRTETGQPLWSGGASNSRGQQNGDQGDGDHIPEPKADVDEWITLDGTLMSFQGGNMTMSTADGALISFQTGQPRFLAEQGVTFQVGDQISVLGFYEGEQFSAGEITQLSTGLRVMLRDPNGRPLWAGPGNSSGQGNGGPQH